MYKALLQLNKNKTTVEIKDKLFKPTFHQKENSSNI